MRYRGFTLIEVIIVITILGILSVVAAPRFIDFQSDAHIASLKSLSSTLKDSAKLQNLKGFVKDGQASKINGYILDDIFFDKGYPIGLSFGDSDDIPEILESLEIDLSQFVYSTNMDGSDPDGALTRELFITLESVAKSAITMSEIQGTNCYIEYESYVVLEEPPLINLNVSGC